MYLTNKLIDLHETIWYMMVSDKILGELHAFSAHLPSLLHFFFLFFSPSVAGGGEC